MKPYFGSICDYPNFLMTNRQHADMTQVVWRHERRAAESVANLPTATPRCRQQASL